MSNGNGSPKTVAGYPVQHQAPKWTPAQQAEVPKNVRMFAGGPSRPQLPAGAGQGAVGSNLTSFATQAAGIPAAMWHQGPGQIFSAQDRAAAMRRQEEEQRIMRQPGIMPQLKYTAGLADPRVKSGGRTDWGATMANLLPYLAAMAGRIGGREAPAATGELTKGALPERFKPITPDEVSLPAAQQAARSAAIDQSVARSIRDDMTKLGLDKTMQKRVGDSLRSQQIDKVIGRAVAQGMRKQQVDNVIRQAIMRDLQQQAATQPPSRGAPKGTRVSAKVRTAQPRTSASTRGPRGTAELRAPETRTQEIMRKLNRNAQRIQMQAAQKPQQPPQDLTAEWTRALQQLQKLKAPKAPGGNQQ